MTGTFPGTRELDLDEADYAVFGAPLDVTTSFYPGTRFGPERIRRHARGFEDYDHRTDQRFTELQVTDAGDLHPWSDVEAYLEFLTAELGALHTGGSVPLLLGGEHTVTVAGVRAANPDHLVCIDAHLDLREEFDGDDWSHATAIHHGLESTDRVTILGARAGSEEEWARAAHEPAVRVVPPGEVTEWVAEPTRERFGDADVYLSIDIDGIDPAYAPATGTREPFGLSAMQARQLVRDVAPHAVGLDLVEVNDRDEGETATLAAKLLREFVFAHADHA